jgi:hypothetical protein
MGHPAFLFTAYQLVADSAAANKRDGKRQLKTGYFMRYMVYSNVRQLKTNLKKKHHK